jgi:hypothetical protein
MVILSAILLSFDMWGEVVSPINVSGESQYRSKFGGVLGFLIAVFISVFTVTRLQKMVNRDDPNVYQVDMGLDLLKNNDFSLNLRDSQYMVGVSSFT